MDKNRSELFGRFSYDDSLTYEDLLAVEENLTADLTALLLRADAAHLDFTPLGDALMFQCAFEAHKLYVYRKIALETAALCLRACGGRCCVWTRTSIPCIYTGCAQGNGRKRNALFPLSRRRASGSGTLARARLQREIKGRNKFAPATRPRGKGRHCAAFGYVHARMVESVDTRDLKSLGREAVRVQVPLRVPSNIKQIPGFVISDESGNLTFWSTFGPLGPSARSKHGRNYKSWTTPMESADSPPRLPPHDQNFRYEDRGRGLGSTDGKRDG